MCKRAFIKFIDLLTSHKIQFLSYSNNVRFHRYGSIMRLDKNIRIRAGPGTLGNTSRIDHCAGVEVTGEVDQVGGQDKKVGRGHKKAVLFLVLKVNILFNVGRVERIKATLRHKVADKPR